MKKSFLFVLVTTIFLNFNLKGMGKDFTLNDSEARKNIRSNVYSETFGKLPLIGRLFKDKKPENKQVILVLNEKPKKEKLEKKEEKNSLQIHDLDPTYKELFERLVKLPKRIQLAYLIKFINSCYCFVGYDINFFKHIFLPFDFDLNSMFNAIKMIFNYKGLETKTSKTVSFAINPKKVFKNFLDEIDELY
ncbi:hypothetical protein GF385_03340 [Candidatus Dependentiae bacterium]|nr:hypothetical protein [Candidatus Dependentiae bacterium]